MNLDIHMLQTIRNAISISVKATPICIYNSVINTGIILQRVDIPMRCFDTPTIVKNSGSNKIM
jgi:hypothetical protein